MPLRLLVCVLFLPTAFVPVASANSFTLAHLRAQPGTTVMLPVESSKQRVQLADLTLTFNPDIPLPGLPPLRVIESEVRAGGFFLNPRMTTRLADKRTLQVSMATTGFSEAAGRLFYVPVRVPEGARPSHVYELELQGNVGSGGWKWPIHSYGGTITVADSPAYPERSLTVQSVTAKPGQTVKVSVINSPDLIQYASFRLEIEYPEEIAQLLIADLEYPVEMEQPDGLMANPLDAVNVKKGGFVFGVVGSRNTNRHGRWVRFPLTIREDARPGTYPIRLAQADMQNALSVYFEPPNRIDGTLTVVSPVTGDADGDRRLSLSDAVLALRMIIGLSPSPAHQAVAADIDLDGRLTLEDPIRILRTVLRLDPLPA